MNWINEHSQIIMIILTAIYGISTIMICYYNRKTVIESRRQVEIMKKQFVENNRARVIPKLVTLEGRLYCLSFNNIGNTMAERLNIDVCDEWIFKLGQTEKCSKTAAILQKLSEANTFLAPQDDNLYPLCVFPDNSGDFDKLCETDLRIEISYTSDDVRYDEDFNLKLGAAAQLISDSDYVRFQSDRIDELKKIRIALEKVEAK